MKTIYLDHAAATPLDPSVLKQMMPFLSDQFHNPSATYLAAKKIRNDVEEARARVAKVLAVRPREIIFTAGATEANNIAIHGVMARYPDAKVLVSAIEHDSVLEAAKQYDHAVIPVDQKGMLDLKELRAFLTDEVALVSVMYANNEIGTIQNLSAIAKIVAEVKAERQKNDIQMPLYLHSDGAQAPNVLPLLVKNMGVDMLSLNGGKIYGPKQSGALYIATGIEITPLLYGGGQEYGLRSGTENVAGIIGFSAALEKASKKRAGESKRLEKLQQYFVQQLTEHIPSAEITIRSNNLHNLVHITIPGTDNERIMMELDEAGIQCAVGSACSASSDEPSHVLKAIGMSEQQAQTSLRFTMGRDTTEEMITQTVHILSGLVK